MRIDEALLIQNEWWKTEKVRKDLAPEFKREAFYELKKMVNLRQIVLLTGLRRVGKTTLLFQLIQELLEKIDAKRILYFSFDEKVEDVKVLLDEYQKITGINWKKEKIYVFLDEIQKLENWSSKIKLLYDNFPNIKFFLTGSSSVELEKEAFSNLVGRYYSLKLEPLSLKEFFEMKTKKKIDNFEIWKEELYLYFSEYLRKPFPEIINESERRVREYLKENVIGKIIYKDLPKKFKNVNEELLINLIEIFYQNPGMILELNNLSKNLKIAKKTLLKHLFFLKFSYLLRIVKNFRISLLVSSRKLQKVYPYHWSLIFGFYENVEKRKLMESVVASLINAKFYWRKNKNEIDFILKNEKIIPVEVKSKEFMQDFVRNLKRLKLKYGILVTEGKEREKEIINDIEIEVVPVFELAYNFRAYYV